MDNLKNDFILISIGSVMLASMLFYLIFFKPMQEELESLIRSKNYIDSTYLRKRGCTSTYGGGELGKDFITYDLRSWDAGKNWYAVEYDYETKELKILGEAEKIYPKLLDHLKAWDKLEHYVIRNGCINPSKDTVGLEILKDAGFTVTKK